MSCIPPHRPNFTLRTQLQPSRFFLPDQKNLEGQWEVALISAKVLQCDGRKFWN